MGSMRSASASAHLTTAAIPPPRLKNFRSPQQFSRNQRRRESSSLAATKQLHRASVRPSPAQSLLALLLGALDLQLAIASFRLKLCLALRAPLKRADRTFAVADLGGGDDLNCDLLNEPRKSAPFPILPGCPILSAVAGEDGKAHPVRTWSRPGALRLPVGGLSSDTATSSGEW